MEISFDSLEQEIYNLLGDKKIMVLATSCNERVTARSMSCIIIGTKICFQTDKTFVKHEQILKNQNVALCVDNVQIEGTAKVKGHPFSEENKEFINKFMNIHKGSYDAYSQMNNEVVIEVEPSLITLWKYENGQPLREFLDITNKKARKEYYNTSKY